MMIIIDKFKLRDLILDGISTEELNSKYDYSHITDMSDLLSGYVYLKSIPQLNTINVTNMNWMFSGCLSLKSIPQLDTRNVIRMNFMFYGCIKLESIPQLNTRNVTNITGVLDDCFNLKNFDPCDFHSYDFCGLDNEYVKGTYPELYI